MHGNSQYNRSPSPGSPSFSCISMYTSYVVPPLPFQSPAVVNSALPSAICTSPPAFWSPSGWPPSSTTDTPNFKPSLSPAPVNEMVTIPSLSPPPPPPPLDPNKSAQETSPETATTTTRAPIDSATPRNHFFFLISFPPEGRLDGDQCNVTTYLLAHFHADVVSE